MDPSYLQMGKESIGHWWILRTRKDNAGNAFVYQGLGRVFVLLGRFLSARLEYYLKRARFPRRLKLFDHLYEFSHGLRVHLFHCPAPMNLHGVFRGSKLISNLFIEPA